MPLLGSQMQEDRFTGVGIQRSFLRCPLVSPVAWWFTYLFIWNRGILHAPLLHLENCASEDFQWPSISHGPSGGKDIVAIPQSQCPLLPPKMYTLLRVLFPSPCSLSTGSSHLFCCLLSFNGAPGCSKEKHMLESEIWMEMTLVARVQVPEECD